jgi:hypothetical protein
MEIEKFEQAKIIKENLDRLERQKYKLEGALKGCGLGVKIEFTNPGPFMVKGDVSFNNKEIIIEMISKEIELVNKEFELI